MKAEFWRFKKSQNGMEDWRHNYVDAAFKKDKEYMGTVVVARDESRVALWGASLACLDAIIGPFGREFGCWGRGKTCKEMWFWEVGY